MVERTKVRARPSFVSTVVAFCSLTVIIREQKKCHPRSSVRHFDTAIFLTSESYFEPLPSDSYKVPRVRLISQLRWTWLCHSSLTETYSPRKRLVASPEFTSNSGCCSSWRGNILGNPRMQHNQVCFHGIWKLMRWFDNENHRITDILETIILNLRLRQVVYYQEFCNNWLTWFPISEGSCACGR